VRVLSAAVVEVELEPLPLVAGAGMPEPLIAAERFPRRVELVELAQIRLGDHRRHAETAFRIRATLPWRDPGSQWSGIDPSIAWNRRATFEQTPQLGGQFRP
jgi:hypothetical protein